MNTKVICWALLGILGSTGAVQAQNSAYEKLPPPTKGPEAPTVVTTDRPETGLSSWITYQRDGCCFGNVGGDTPIGTELFLRVGPSVPVGGEFFGRILDTGWMIEFGGRALCFNQQMDRAWFVEASVSNTHNHSNAHVPILVRGEDGPLSVQYYNRTFVNLGFGREWYLYPATCGNRNWRFGVDGGGRYGSGNVGFYDSHHLTDVIGGMYAAVHTDVEIPFCACHNQCIFQAGFRLEYGYTWSDILTHTSDLQDLNFLFTVGIRY